ncbi:MAG: 4Fe-4S binding protein [Desulfitobacterium hafniense]|nr:4Fe-4S binding protein [Desulfitobacterium hafniense]
MFDHLTNSSKNYQLNVCSPNCPKAANDWSALSDKLHIILENYDFDTKIHQKSSSHYHYLPKVAIAGCPNGCSQPKIKDFGILGYVRPQITDKLCLKCLACKRSCLEDAITLTETSIKIDGSKCLACGDCIRSCPAGTIKAGEKGWELRQGGRVGRHPRFAEPVGYSSKDKEVVEWVSRTLTDFLEKGKMGERLTHFLERTSKLISP